MGMGLLEFAARERAWLFLKLEIQSLGTLTSAKCRVRPSKYNHGTS